MFAACDTNSDMNLDDTETNSTICHEIVAPISSYTNSLSISEMFNEWEPTLARTELSILATPAGYAGLLSEALRAAPVL